LYQAQPLKHAANKAVNNIKKELNKFADWILSFVPEPIKKTVNKRVDNLKEKVNRIFSPQRKTNSIERISENLQD